MATHTTTTDSFAKKAQEIRDAVARGNEDITTKLDAVRGSDSLDALPSEPTVPNPFDQFNKS